MRFPYNQTHLAKVSGVERNTIKQWFSRGVATGLREHTPDPGAGYRFETCMEFATAAELRNLFGMPLAQAFDAAREFAMGGDGVLEGLHGARNPARPFAVGSTFLLVRGDGATVVNVPPGADLLHYVPRSMRQGFIVLDLLDLYRRVVAILEGDPLGDWRDQAAQ